MFTGPSRPRAAGSRAEGPGAHAGAGGRVPVTGWASTRPVRRASGTSSWAASAERPSANPVRSLPWSKIVAAVWLFPSNRPRGLEHRTARALETFHPKKIHQLCAGNRTLHAAGRAKPPISSDSDHEAPRCLFVYKEKARSESQVSPGRPDQDGVEQVGSQPQGSRGPKSVPPAVPSRIPKRRSRRRWVRLTSEKDKRWFEAKKQKGIF